MKPYPFVALLGFACAGGWAAAFAADPAARVEVVYVDPQKFTDVPNGYTQTDSARDFYLGEIRRYIEQQAARRLAGGDSLRVTITDVQLEGKKRVTVREFHAGHPLRPGTLLGG